jgi:ornithine cyclodeaminase
MRVILRPELEQALVPARVLEAMHDALIAQVRGECATPMPMHLDIPAENAEVHMKSSYRRGGKYFVLKVASTFPGNLARGLSTGAGMMLLCSAETGAPDALLDDGGHLTDVRTAAVTAMVTRELRRRDTALGIVGSGIQARLQAQWHAHVLDLKDVWIWGRTPERVEQAAREISGARVHVAATPAEVARNCRLIVTCTASRAPLLMAADLQPGTHVAAVGSDAPGKQELDPEILRRASLVLVDSGVQCERLGELQHAPEVEVIEIGAFCQAPVSVDPSSITVADFTGLGVEDLFISELCVEKP